MTSGLRGKTYEEKLNELNLTTLQERRIRGDMIQTWKILHQHDDMDPSIFDIYKGDCTQGTRLADCDLNIKLKHVNSDIRSNFFSVRVANQWNRLPSELKEEWTLNRFKMHYDRWCRTHDLAG